MVAEDQFRQNMEEFNPMAALLGMDVTLRKELRSAPRTRQDKRA